jgi:pyruvate dehydrogenase E2 component (dihydrolipoamide acetyltransferase)
LAREIVMPALEMAQDEGTLVRWLQVEGARVRKGEPLMEIETDKAVMEIEAPESGILASLSAQAGQKVLVGRVIGLLLTEQEYVGATKPHTGDNDDNVGPSLRSGQSSLVSTAATSIAAAAPSKSGTETVVAARLSPASPKARRLATEHGIDLLAAAGSGPGGGVIAADVAELVRRAPTPENGLEYIVVPASKMRGIISERLQRSYQEAPHIALTLSVDMGQVLRLIQNWNDRAGAKLLKINAALAKAVATTLLQFPRLNAHLVKGEIREFKRVHMGFAFALADGLLVLTLRDAHKKGLAAIQSELDDLFGRARRGRYRLDEMKGSTFTISNLGMFGIEQFSAILNPPEVGLLSVGVIKDTPTVVDGQIVSRSLMQVTINADHRAVDGAEGAKFLKALKQTLEDPWFSAAELAEIST